jgi:hypothetical protein
MPDLIDLLRGEDEELWSAPRLLRADIQEAAQQLSQHEARFLVNAFYRVQHDRIQSHNQAVALRTRAEPTRLTTWFEARYHQLEGQLQRVLDAYSQRLLRGQWLRAQMGIGPVLAGGLLAHLDNQPPATVGHWWAFGGYNPTVEWLGTERARAVVQAVAPEATRRPLTAEELLELGRRTGRNPLNVEKMARLAATPKGADPGEADPQAPFPMTRAVASAVLAKRPWNADLKTLLWKCAESFVKCSGRDDCLYGHFYHQRKAYEQAQNAQGCYATQAARELATKAIGRDTEAYQHYAEGRLPPGHIHARCERWVAKLFLSHFHLIATWDAYGRLPVKPFALAHQGHADFWWPRHTDLLPGLTAALEGQYGRRRSARPGNVCGP